MSARSLPASSNRKPPPAAAPVGGASAIPVGRAPQSGAKTGLGIGALLALAGALGFSLKGILVKLAYAAYPIEPLTLLALRMLYSAPFFVALAVWASRGAAPLPRRDWATIGGLGFLGYYLSSYLDFLGLTHISASLERLILFLYPTIVVLISALFLGKRVSRRIGVALVASYAGILMVFRHDLGAQADPWSLAIGGLFAFGSATSYATYLVVAGSVIRKVGSIRFTALAMIASTTFVLAHFLATRPVEALAVPARVHGLVLTMAVLSTVLPTVMTSDAIRRIGADQTAVLGCIGPISTVLLAAWLLGEPLGASQLAGATLVVAGVLLVTLRR